MYSRPNDKAGRDVRVPHNYGGSIFSSQNSPTRAVPVRDDSYQRRQTPIPRSPLHSECKEPLRHTEEIIEEQQQPPNLEESDVRADIEQSCNECEGCDKCEECDRTEKQERHQDDCEKKPLSILSPIGALGGEELLIIALALIIFQSGKEPELALLLLALLFIN